MIPEEAICDGEPSLVVLREYRISRSSRTLVPCRDIDSIREAKRCLHTTNLSQHGLKIIRNAPSPHSIKIRLMLTPDVLWIGGVVWGATVYTDCEPRHPARHEMLNVIRDCPDGDGFAPAR